VYFDDSGLKGCFTVLLVTAIVGLVATMFVLVKHVWPWLKTIIHAATA
jgi:hypothetical protein